MGVPWHWGATPAEIARPYPCDALEPAPAARWLRAVSVRAPADRVFRWLCQLKVAPYSYDLIDNLGRRSPRQLTDGADDLATGQQFMTIFTLVDFAPGKHLTLRLTDPWALRAFGALVITYAVHPADDGHTRLVAKLNTGRLGDGPLHGARRAALAWGDLIMMRRQLLNLRDLAERGQL